jgi:hypothetical protein
MEKENVCFKEAQREGFTIMRKSFPIVPGRVGIESTKHLYLRPVVKRFSLYKPKRHGYNQHHLTCRASS